MIKTKHRNIPQIMGTQHPDNAGAPYWEEDGDGFISIYEEVKEAASSLQDVGCEEYLWDWEGKHVDEGVIEKLLTEHHDFFSKKQIGKDVFVTFRIPNIWEEKGRSLARAFMNMLTAEEFARDLGLHTPPLFEVILPMADKASKLMKMQKTFAELAAVKHKLFEDEHRSFDHIEMIPLVEAVDSMVSIRKLLEQYTEMHKKQFKRTQPYMRVFLARSDPALMSGLVPAVLGNKMALSEMYAWSADTGIDVYPWSGAGSLPFRGGLRPNDVDYFVKTYPGMRGATVQSSFRYDYPMRTVKKGVEELKTKLKNTTPVIFDEEKKREIKKIISAMEAPYQTSVAALAGHVHEISAHVPSRRERRLHIGLLGYGRKMGKTQLPRAITFTGSLYSLGIPPELVGTGRGLAALSDKQRAVLLDVYPTLVDDIRFAGQYLNKENVAFLAQKNKRMKLLQDDIAALESEFGMELGPKSAESFIHRNWTSTLFFQMKNKKSIGTSIIESGKIRKSLG